MLANILSCMWFNSLLLVYLWNMFCIPSHNERILLYRGPAPALRNRVGIKSSYIFYIIWNKIARWLPVYPCHRIVVGRCHSGVCSVPDIWRICCRPCRAHSWRCRAGRRSEPCRDRGHADSAPDSDPGWGNAPVHSHLRKKKESSHYFSQHWQRWKQSKFYKIKLSSHPL